MVTGSETRKRQIFSLLTFWVVAGFTLLTVLDTQPAYSSLFEYLEIGARGFALLTIYSLAAPSNRTAFGATVITGLAWVTSHVFFAELGEFDGAHAMLAVASTTTLVANAFFAFDAKQEWRAPKWAGVAVLVLAGLTWFEADCAISEPDCISSCHGAHPGACINQDGRYLRPVDPGDQQIVF